MFKGGEKIRKDVLKGGKRCSKEAFVGKVEAGIPIFFLLRLFTSREVFDKRKF